VPFLVAVTGHDSSRQAAWGAIRHLEFSGHRIHADPDQPEPSDDSVR
jgi:hypothetical protein